MTPYKCFQYVLPKDIRHNFLLPSLSIIQSFLLVSVSCLDLSEVQLHLGLGLEVVVDVPKLRSICPE